MDFPKPQLVKIAKARGIVPGRKNKRQLCDEIEENNSLHEVVIVKCMDRSKPEIVRLAGDRGIDIGKKTKRQLCDEMER